MRILTSTRPVLVLGAICLGMIAGCSGNEPSTTAPPASDAAGPSPSTTFMPTLPVADVFEPPAWGLEVPSLSLQNPPVVTGDRVVFLQGGEVRAVDPQGKDTWTTPFKKLEAPDLYSRPNYQPPVLIPADLKTVAVVDQGGIKGEGLNEDTDAIRVTLIGVENGRVVKTVTLSGASRAKVSKYGRRAIGLVFQDADNRVVAVLPDGEVQKVAVSVAVASESHPIVGGITVGSNVIPVWGGTQKGDFLLGPTDEPGFSGDGWESVSAAPGPDYTTATIEATDADHLLLGRWVMPGGNSVSQRVQFQVLDASSGKVLARPNCSDATLTENFVGSPNRQYLVASPNLQHHVDGALLLGADGKAQCIGGSPGQKQVILSAVTDDGRAFGTGGDGLVDLAPDGTARVMPMPPGAHPPIGIMNGDVAVHWNADHGVITGNPIR